MSSIQTEIQFRQNSPNLRNKVYSNFVSDTNQAKRKIISVSKILLKRAKTAVPYDPGEIRRVMIKGREKVRNQHEKMQVY